MWRTRGLRGIHSTIRQREERAQMSDPNTMERWCKRALCANAACEGGRWGGGHGGCATRKEEVCTSSCAGSSMVAEGGPGWRCAGVCTRVVWRSGEAERPTHALVWESPPTHIMFGWTNVTVAVLIER